MVYAACNLHQVWMAPQVRSAARPRPWADKVVGHTPRVMISGEESTGTTSHPMTDEHYIVGLYITDQDDNMIDKVQLNPTDQPEATYSFTLPAEVTSVTPWSLCDDHDLWLGASVDR